MRQSLEANRCLYFPRAKFTKAKLLGLRPRALLDAAASQSCSWPPHPFSLRMSEPEGSTPADGAASPKGWWQRMQERGHREEELQQIEAERFAAARRQSPEENQVAKQRALKACDGLHQKLLECYRQSWLPLCNQEYDNFWECFRRERGFTRISLIGKLSSSRQSDPDAERAKEQ